MVQIGHATHGDNIPEFAKAPHVLILEARFYNDINDHMIAGAIEILEKAGATWEIQTVPGALEIPVALKFSAHRKNGRPFDAYVVLGCVIRGGTTHYEIVSEESNRGVMKMAMKYDLPLGMFWSAGFGVRWVTPIAPLSFEWGFPLTPRPGDPKFQFEFNIKNSF